MEGKSFKIYGTSAVIMPTIASFVLITEVLFPVDREFHVLVGTGEEVGT